MSEKQERFLTPQIPFGMTTKDGRRLLWALLSARLKQCQPDG
ncbi:MAG TPA: hypothetical protein VMJ35_12230 [Dongiaceae bacterium]|nr:hypothetical protein [Dongiaceae bacterium]